jgi:hypothetical protein
VDLTSRCDLRCAHCYYYRNAPEGDDLPDAAFLERLARWQAVERVESMLWLGGEPLLREPVLRVGARLFPRNAVFTNGLRPVPRDLGCGVLVSLDGPPPAHDVLRGDTWGRITANLAGMDRPLVHCTLTGRTADAAESLLEHLDGLAGGVIFGLYTPARGETSELVLSEEARRAVVAGLRRLRESWDGVLLNTQGMLDAMAGDPAVWKEACPYLAGHALALDHRLRPKHPCSYGPGADCDRCGCVAMHLRAAARRGDAAALGILRAVFSESPGPRPGSPAGGAPSIPAHPHAAGRSLGRPRASRRSSRNA